MLQVQRKPEGAASVSGLYMSKPLACRKLSQHLAALTAQGLILELAACQSADHHILVHSTSLRNRVLWETCGSTLAVGHMQPGCTAAVLAVIAGSDQHVEVHTTCTEWWTTQMGPAITTSRTTGSICSTRQAARLPSCPAHLDHSITSYTKPISRV